MSYVHVYACACVYVCVCEERVIPVTESMEKTTVAQKETYDHCHLPSQANMYSEEGFTKITPWVSEVSFLLKKSQVTPSLYPNRSDGSKSVVFLRLDAMDRTSESKPKRIPGRGGSWVPNQKVSVFRHSFLTMSTKAIF